MRRWKFVVDIYSCCLQAIYLRVRHPICWRSVVADIVAVDTAEEEVADTVVDIAGGVGDLDCTAGCNSYCPAVHIVVVVDIHLLHTVLEVVLRRKMADSHPDLVEVGKVSYFHIAAVAAVGAADLAEAIAINGF